MALARPRARISGYQRGKYNVLVCRKDGEIFIAWTGWHKQTAFKMAHKNSPSMDKGVHRGCVVRPGNDLMAAIAWVACGWQPAS